MHWALHRESFRGDRIGCRLGLGGQCVFDSVSDRVDRLRVCADRVERTVLAPAGDLADRLASDVEPDRAEHAVRDAVDEHFAALTAMFAAAEAMRMRDLMHESADLSVRGSSTRRLELVPASLAGMAPAGRRGTRRCPHLSNQGPGSPGRAGTCRRAAPRASGDVDRRSCSWARPSRVPPPRNRSPTRRRPTSPTRSRLPRDGRDRRVTRGLGASPGAAEPASRSLRYRTPRPLPPSILLDGAPGLGGGTGPSPGEARLPVEARETLAIGDEQARWPRSPAAQRKRGLWRTARAAAHCSGGRPAGAELGTAPSHLSAAAARSRARG
jgi:hypothetical protein